jgi:hypothetical protein
MNVCTLQTILQANKSTFDLEQNFLMNNNNK